MKEWMKVAEIIKFADTIDRHIEGILNHAEHPIHSGKLEGTHKVIKTIRRKAYGFHDIQFFSLKIMEVSRELNQVELTDKDLLPMTSLILRSPESRKTDSCTILSVIS